MMLQTTQSLLTSTLANLSSEQLCYPLRDVQVKVLITEMLQNSIELSGECRDCKKRFEDSDILGAERSVSWRDIDSFNLKAIVSCWV